MHLRTLIVIIELCIGAATVGTGGDHFYIGGTNDVLVAQLLGHSFQNARNFTVSSHQNAAFSI